VLFRSMSVKDEGLGPENNSRRRQMTQLKPRRIERTLAVHVELEIVVLQKPAFNEAVVAPSEFGGRFEIERNTRRGIFVDFQFTSIHHDVEEGRCMSVPFHAVADPSAHRLDELRFVDGKPLH